MKKRPIFILILLAAALQMTAGCAVTSNLEELKTLKAMVDEDKEKARDLKQEDKIFENIQKAIREERLKPGMSSEEVTRQWGGPIIKAVEGQSERWAYKEKTGDWFKGAKVYLFFDQEGRLEKWQCIRAACGEEV